MQASATNLLKGGLRIFASGHRVRFSGTGLTIRHDGRVVAVEYVVDSFPPAHLSIHRRAGMYTPRKHTPDWRYAALDRTSAVTALTAKQHPKPSFLRNGKQFRRFVRKRSHDAVVRTAVTPHPPGRIAAGG
eukprot:9487191-Pyramimonas_sp.AAC.1